MSNSNLKFAFHFDNEDLDANRNGYMTKEQRIRLRRKCWEKVGPYLFRGIFILMYSAILTGEPLSMSLGVCLVGPLFLSMVYLCFLE